MADGADWRKVGWQSFWMPYADFVDAEHGYVGIERELAAGESDAG